jgi:hypothetical protein
VRSILLDDSVRKDRPYASSSSRRPPAEAGPASAAQREPHRDHGAARGGADRGADGEPHAHRLRASRTGSGGVDLPAAAAVLPAGRARAGLGGAARRAARRADGIVAPGARPDPVAGRGTGREPPGAGGGHPALQDPAALDGDRGARPFRHCPEDRADPALPRALRRLLRRAAPGRPRVRRRRLD